MEISYLFQMPVVLRLWKTGFTINDEPLRPFDDPQNRQFLQSIQKGWEGSRSFLSISLTTNDDINGNSFTSSFLEMNWSVSRLLLFDWDNSSKIIMSPFWLHQWCNYDHYFIVTDTSTRSLVTCGTYYSLFHFSMSEFDHSFVFNLMFHKCWVLTSSEIKEDCQLWYKACPAPPSISITFALHDTPVPNCRMLRG